MGAERDASGTTTVSRSRRRFALRLGAGACRAASAMRAAGAGLLRGRFLAAARAVRAGALGADAGTLIRFVHDDFPLGLLDDGMSSMSELSAILLHLQRHLRRAVSLGAGTVAWVDQMVLVRRPVGCAVRQGNLVWRQPLPATASSRRVRRLRTCSITFLGLLSGRSATSPSDGLLVNVRESFGPPVER